MTPEIWIMTHLPAARSGADLTRPWYELCDSYHLVELLAEAEEYYGVWLDLQAGPPLETLADLAAALRRAIPHTP